MSLTTLSLVTGVFKEAVGFFFTTKAAKRKARMDNLRLVLATIQDEKRTRSAMGWVLTILIVAGILYDIIANGGENFESLMVLFASVAGA